MAAKDNSNPFQNLTTRAFELLRKWMKKGDLTETETHELVEIRKEMPAESFRTELKALNTKFNVMIWLFSALTATGVLGFLANIFDWGV